MSFFDPMDPAVQAGRGRTFVATDADVKGSTWAERVASLGPFRCWSGGTRENLQFCQMGKPEDAGDTEIHSGVGIHAKQMNRWAERKCLGSLQLDKRGLRSKLEVHFAHNVDCVDV